MNIDRQVVARWLLSRHDPNWGADGAPHKASHDPESGVGRLAADLAPFFDELEVIRRLASAAAAAEEEGRDLPIDSIYYQDLWKALQTTDAHLAAIKGER